MRTHPDRSLPPTWDHSPELWTAEWLGYVTWQVDPDFERWRDEQLQRCDEDYRAWRRERFGDEFERWRAGRNRAEAPAASDIDPQMLFERS